MEQYDDATIQQILAMGELEAQDEELQRQLAEAKALRKQGPERYGALAGGVQAGADMLNAYYGRQASQKAQSGRKDLGPKMTAGRQSLWGLLHPAPAEPGVAAPLEDFSSAGIPEYLRRQ
jgi:hypothetical protein